MVKNYGSFLVNILPWFQQLLLVIKRQVEAVVLVLWNFLMIPKQLRLYKR